MDSPAQRRDYFFVPLPAHLNGITNFSVTPGMAPLAA